jgi:hypothetical protein
MRGMRSILGCHPVLKMCSWLVTVLSEPRFGVANQWVSRLKGRGLGGRMDSS